VIPTVEFSREISTYLEELTATDGVSKVVLAYTEFKSAMSKKLRTVQFLPFDPKQFMASDMQQNPVQEHSLYEPSRMDVVQEIREQLLKGLLHQCYMDSLASEYGSRMVAMDNASRNCKELTNKLTLRLNRERQASITQEIAEIVGGAAGLQ
jgi:F-type H+-transporting ATPase subunit gamma